MLSGQPVRGANLVFGVYRYTDISWIALTSKGAFLDQQRSTTGDDGAFRFREGDPGLLFVRAPGYGRLVITPEARAAYITASGALVVPLAPAEKLRGVLTLDGQPLADTAVGIARLIHEADGPGDKRSSADSSTEARESVAREWVGWIKTDERGVVAWNEIAAGRYLMEFILITHAERNFGVRIRRLIEVRPGAENRIEVGVDPRGLSFKGRLLTPDGRPAGGVALIIRPRFECDYFELAFDIAEQNDSEFLFPRLRPGRYEIEALEYVETRRRTRLGTIDLTEDTTRDLVLEEGKPEDE